MLERESNDRYNRSRWKCLCDCGKKTVVESGHLRYGHTKSCGRCKENVYEIKGDITICRISTGDEVVFDTEDYQKVKEYTWCTDNHGYVKTTLKSGGNLKIHRLIMCCNDKEIFIDHINGNVLDNRKENLRFATSQQNSFNSKLSKANTSGYKGVYYYGRRGKYAAHITKNRKRIHLGYFINPVEAAIAYNKAASFYFGEFAKLNEIAKEKGGHRCINFGTGLKTKGKESSTWMATLHKKAGSMMK